MKRTPGLDTLQVRADPRVIVTQQSLQSLFIKATGVVTGNPTGEQFRLDEIDDPLTFFRQRLDPRLSHYDHIACDVTDNCNLRCPFCINDFSNASSAKMNERHFARVVEIAQLGNDQSVFAPEGVEIVPGDARPPA